MKIEWQENVHCWHGMPKTVFPRFEAWRSDESVKDLWCLNMIKNPNARLIKVRHLQSLDVAKDFAEGLLAEFDYVPDWSLPIAVGSDVEQSHTAAVAGVPPLSQVT